MGRKLSKAEPSPAKTATQEEEEKATPVPSEGQECEQSPPATADPAGEGGGVPEALVGDMPDVQPHAIQEQARKEAEIEKATENASEMRDSSGNKFDPEIHRVGEDGQPVLTPTGRFSKAKGKGRKASPKLGGLPAEVKPDPEAQTRAQARAAGITLANMGLAIAQGLGGEEFKPSEEERVMLEAGTADYCEAKGVSDLPPGLALASIWGAYLLPKFAKPKTRSRLGAFWEKIKARIQNWRAKRASKEAEKAVDDV